LLISIDFIAPFSGFARGEGNKLPEGQVS